ncbi:glucose-1-phosphate adenylyltransferase [Anaerocolumna sedimenticola]|uniref:Glucose-1-phosphate adenylyltransferase n=1 Tax=Anaerocolumna sedimenticola TaxID=2696063 RepID=A0A6P1TKD1_9FIRM|nr:glucose-1-phosphate adenylyltransferase [Anaerocolumna sedimenticola]QHQ60747.1 glucose-1-phosphate adenylyltransferase [Anaerocolumna sedimenticola]
MQKECIAMLLAGGIGGRLGVLTKERAKPAVPFGGKYRIIDFTLSNCVNSRIDTVGVLTQYQPLELNDYIGNGQPWDLDRIEGGVHILPPYQKRESSDWYSGTANAIKQNIPFIERYNPKYVLILSGDHIYKMDYSKMLLYHKEKKADCTIAVIDVDIKEASRFGIMNTKENDRIYEFEEKPKEPKSTKASMGIYIFTWEKLKLYLEQDDKDDNSQKDFGKNIIPAMITAGENLFAYPFQGYWKDVGTIESLWQSNMDLLNSKYNIFSADTDWKIYARSPVLPPHYISTTAKVTNSIISGGCTIDGEINSSVIFYGVTIERNARISNSIIMPGTRIGEGCLINYAIIDENCKVGANAIIGTSNNNKEDIAQLITVIGEDVIINEGDVIEENSMIESEKKR